MAFEEPGDVQDIHLVVDTIPTLAWSAAPDASADFFNQRWLDSTGLSAKQGLGSGWEVTIHPDELPRILETFREALNSAKPLEVEGRFDGEFRWLLFRGSPLRDGSGKVAKWYGQIPILGSGSVLKMPSARAKHPCSKPNGYRK
jgi:PAS domain S-box-containing protein